MTTPATSSSNEERAAIQAQLIRLMILEVRRIKELLRTTIGE